MYYSHSNTPIAIAHFPGRTRIENKQLIEDLKEIEFNKPENISIVSLITKDTIESSPLHYQLSKNNYSYINPLAKMDISWNNVKKIKFILQALKEVKTEYTLVLDGADVVILNDLDNIINEFKKYNKKIIYNSTIWRFPKDVIDRIMDRQKYGKYCFLNAGCCIGKTADLIDFYSFAQEIVENREDLTNNSEQYYIRKAFNLKQNEVFFDYDCRIFQIWHKVKMETKGNDVYID